VAATVRIAAATHRTLAALAKTRHLTLQDALTEAVDVYERHLFLAGVAEDFARLRADEPGWAGEVEERRAWDETLADSRPGRKRRR
jgi:hypothetical protein